MDFDKLIIELTKLQDALGLFLADDANKGREDIRQRLEAVTMTIMCLKEYVEPWGCPICGKQTKIPYDHKNKRHCKHCQNDYLFPYAYLEQDRMNKQMHHLLACAQHYKDQPNGGMAKETLRTLNAVGAFTPK